MDPDYHLDSGYIKYPFVKTHLLPEQLEPGALSIPAVYIIRDGRDAMVSLAYHRKNIVAPGSDYYENLKAAIIAEKGTFFGGWSKNVNEWQNRAGIIIRFEDLINDPIGEIERLRKIAPLPEPDKEKLPNFQDLKFGTPEYGCGKDRGYSNQKMQELSKKSFRKGKVGNWKDEMPPELQDLFWSYHGDTMEAVGYSYDGSLKDVHPDLNYQFHSKSGLKAIAANKKKKILIESNKIVSSDNDGVKRYQIELLKGLLPLVENLESRWEIDLYIKGKIVPLIDYKEQVTKSFSADDLSEERVDRSGIKKILFSLLLKISVFLKKNNIYFFHSIYWFLVGLLRVIKGWVFSSFQKITTLVSMLTFNKIFPKGLSGSAGKFGMYDLIHLPLMHHCIPFENTDTPIVVTVHDLTHLYFPEHHTQKNILNSKMGLTFVENKNADVIAVSKSTRNDLLKDSNVNSLKVHVIYEAVERAKFHHIINGEDKRQIRQKYGIEEIGEYLVCLSTIEPRKNLENTIKGYLLLIKENPDSNLSLVIAGKKGWKFDLLLLRNSEISKRVRFIGFVDDEDISAIYSDSVAMSYLSFYEGFGLPPLEAMCCGTPVIYGDNSSLVEVVADGGIACDPSDIAAIKDCFYNICFDKKLRKQKQRAALKQSLKFSRNHTVQQTIELYESIIKKK